MKIFNSLKSFVGKCKRVWMVLKKPTKEELIRIAQISALGILVIGFIGFIISIVMGFIV
jgi:protein transport protein SEC61 subunit gamma-like protein